MKEGLAEKKIKSTKIKSDFLQTFLLGMEEKL